MAKMPTLPSQPGPVDSKQGRMPGTADDAKDKLHFFLPMQPHCQDIKALHHLFSIFCRQAISSRCFRRSLSIRIASLSACFLVVSARHICAPSFSHGAQCNAALYSLRCGHVRRMGAAWGRNKSGAKSYAAFIASAGEQKAQLNTSSMRLRQHPAAGQHNRSGLTTNRNYTFLNSQTKWIASRPYPCLIYHKISDGRKQ